LAFGLGISLGWYGGMRMGGDAEERIEVEKTPSRVRPERRGGGTAAASDHVKVAAQAQAFLSMEDEERNKRIEELELLEIGPLLVRLMDQAGPDGLGYALRSDIDELIVRWGKEDFDGAWAWADACANRGLAAHVQGELLDQLVETDPDRAFEMYLAGVKDDEDFGSGVPGKILGTKVGDGPAVVLDFLARMPKDSSVSGVTLQYPDGFDFAALLDGMKVFYQGNHDGRPPVMPSNVMEVWSASDPTAAHAWWLANGKIGFEGWGEILDSLDGQQGPQASATWAADRWSEATPEQRENMAKELNGWMGAPERGRVEAIVGELAPQEVDGFLKEVLMEHGFGYQNGKQFADLMGQISDPSIRLEILRDQFEHRTVTSEQFSDELLGRWKVSRSELESVIAEED
jgi:hypothetical protein